MADALTLLQALGVPKSCNHPPLADDKRPQVRCASGWTLARRGPAAP